MADRAIQAWFQSEDNSGQHAQDTLASGRNLGHWELVAAMVARTPDCVKELENLGVKLRKEEDGAFSQEAQIGP